MSKNFIPQIAEILGLQLGEEFKVKGYGEVTYMLTNEGLMATDDDQEKEWTPANVLFVALLTGTEEIVKLPWKPRKGDVYYTFVRTGIDCTYTLISYQWDGCVIDIALLKAGWVFRTRQEAEAALPAVAAEMGVEYEL